MLPPYGLSSAHLGKIVTFAVQCPLEFLFWVTAQKVKQNPILNLVRENGDTLTDPKIGNWLSRGSKTEGR